MADSVAGLNEADLVIVRQHVERVLNSQALNQADRLRRFLQYVVNHALSDRTDSPNQFSIAMDVFDRDETFDPTIDAIVRVEAGRLRSKLLEYYDDEGQEDLVRISLPKRSYAIRFQFRNKQSHSVPASSTIIEAQPESHRLAGATQATIAVLPFDNMSTDPEQEYFSDGITEDLITDLSQLSGLSVIARQSTFTYKGVATDARSVGTELGAEFIVEGSVRKIGSQIRINAQLIDGKTGKHIWAERFDRKSEDIFDLQDDVNRKILDALKLQISTANQSRAQHKGTENIEAHDYLLRGMKEEHTRTREGFARARYCFNSALELDPGYANAYGRLCFNTIYPWIAGWNDSREETVEEGVKLANQALTLDANNAFAYAALCWALLWQSEHDQSVAAGRKAIELDPNNVAALERLAIALAFSAEAEEALQCLARAQTLNPLHGYHFPSGLSYFVLEQYPAVISALRSSINANPGFLPSYLYLAASLSLLDRPDEVRPVVESIRALEPDYGTERIHFSTFKYPQDQDRFSGALKRALET